MLSSPSTSVTAVILLTAEVFILCDGFRFEAGLVVFFGDGLCESFLVVPFAAAADLNGL